MMTGIRWEGRDGRGCDHGGAGSRVRAGAVAAWNGDAAAGGGDVVIVIRGGDGLR
jgi:hypothetical protein